MVKYVLSLLFLFISVQSMDAYVLVYPGGGSASLLDAFSVTAAVDNGQVHGEITVWLTSGGDIDYAVDIETMTYSGTCSDITAATLHEIVEAVADEAIMEGVARDYPGCALIPFDRDVRIWSAACGDRSGTGCGTDFAACGATWAYRLYGVYCAGDLSPIITQKSGTGSTGCSGTCEPSYDL